MFAAATVFAIIQSVAIVALLLIALGSGLSALTWWFWTSARPEPVSLAPLEIMSDRGYIKAGEDERKHMIDSAHDLVAAAKSPRESRQPTRRPERETQPKSSQSRPVDPLLK
ncbi:MAG: hypothetical protein ACYC06_08895 [Ilumatobacteraceae bacterium]